MENQILVDYNAEKFGKRLRMIRKTNKMTQEKLAELLFLSVDSISNYENGKATCMPEHLTKICQIFNVSADYFYFEKDKKLYEKSKIGNIISKLEQCNDFDIERISQMISILLAKPAA